MNYSPGVAARGSRDLTEGFLVVVFAVGSKKGSLHEEICHQYLHR